jgi:large subunit ribosomal protein L29
MDRKEINEKSSAELRSELGTLLRLHFGLRIQRATQQLTNTSQLRVVRRDIARVKTMLAKRGVK